jgi:hypothetical protein
MSHDKTTIAIERTEVKTPRTHLADLSPAGQELSQDELSLVSGGLRLPGKRPLDDDATYVHPGIGGLD